MRDRETLQGEYPKPPLCRVIRYGAPHAAHPCHNHVVRHSILGKEASFALQLRRCCAATIELVGAESYTEEHALGDRDRKLLPPSDAGHVERVHQHVMCPLSSTASISATGGPSSEERAL